MTIPKIRLRVEELMILQGLSISNELLVINIAIIYLQAQRDTLVEQKKNI